MASAYQFEAAGIRPPWLTTAPEDNPLAAPSWNDFMTWDPNLSQGPDVKLSGPACPLKPELQRPPLSNRNHNSPSPDAALHVQGSNPPSTQAMSGTHSAPFTFGGTSEMPPAFDFDSQLSSPPVDGQHHGSFYPSQMAWPQHMAANTLFSPPRFEPTSLPSASVPPLSNPPSLQHSHSPSSVQNARTSSSSGHSTPEPASENPKKRKTVIDDDDSAPSSKKEKHQPPKKTAHNMIEKRYRTNLNDKIAALRDSVPSLRVMSRGAGANEEDDDPEDLEGLTPAHKLNKATVLSKATEYIRHLEKRNKRLQDEVATLQGRIESYEKMAISGPMTLHGPMGTPDGNRYQHEDPFTPAHNIPMSAPPQGMIPVPEHIAQMRQNLPPQHHYAHAYPQYGGGSRPGPPMVNGRRNNGMVGKLMVGSLAGLMILEGLVEREQSQEDSDGRGLFALPFNVAAILTPRVSLGAASAQFPLAKLLLIFGAVFWIVAPMFDFSTKTKKTSSAIHLARAPSLASPMEVRHRAWLTAIQTVWVPRHNFLLEVAALSLKMLKLSTRKLIGWPYYAFISGMTKEQEAARIKAWSIALDAQLTGGDAEISKSRLVLTLMASGTLPDTPGRLMLKSLHLRVLLWELANAGHGLSWIMSHLSAKLARRYWNMARSEHRIALNLASKPDSDAEPLPDHLAALLEKECDDVFSFPIIQRAYNLAWNSPIADHTTADPCMDGVVGDFAISSPLDALAAWYSSFLLRQTLGESLNDGKITGSITDALTLSARVAPPNSQAQLRALVAKAVLLEDDRAAHIATAFAALPIPPSNTSSSGTKLINLVSGPPAAIDVRKALTLAKCLTLVDSSNEDARRQAIFVVNNTYLTEATTTLLSFVAGYKIFERFIRDPALHAETTHGLERLAGSLRMWVGHDTGRRSGLDSKIRGRIVKRCLDASKMLVGLTDREDFDPGYFSSSVKDDDVSP